MNGPDRVGARPLAGRTVVVTRARAQAGELSERLRACGAVVVEVPTIDVVDPADGGQSLAAAAAAVVGGRYDWVALASANAACRLVAAGGFPAPVKVAVVGPGTAAALVAAGVVADLVADRYLAAGLVDAFPVGVGSVLLPQAEGARPTLAEGLRAKGWTVAPVVAYRTVPVDVPREVAARARSADAIAFTSASAVLAFVDSAGPGALPPVVACIGPVTAAAAAGRGVAVSIVATEHTLDGLVAALASALAGTIG